MLSTEDALSSLSMESVSISVSKIAGASFLTSCCLISLRGWLNGGGCSSESMSLTSPRRAIMSRCEASKAALFFTSRCRGAKLPGSCMRLISNLRSISSIDRTTGAFLSGTNLVCFLRLISGNLYAVRLPFNVYERWNSFSSASCMPFNFPIFSPPFCNSSN